jgi:membrane-bound lytic murein transglycosylase B
MVFDPQIMARKMNPLLEAKLSPPEEKAVEPGVDERYLNPILLAGAYGYLRENKVFLAGLKAQYGVPPEILVALLLVESKLGLNVGTARSVWSLANMALAGDLGVIEPYLSRQDLSPEIRDWLAARTRQKANWAYEELEALLRYAQALGIDPLEIPGSAYGAIGLCQFFPARLDEKGFFVNFGRGIALSQDDQIPCGLTKPSREFHQLSQDLLGIRHRSLLLQAECSPSPLLQQ